MGEAPASRSVRIGQTSLIHFGSQVLASVAGFVATLYIARELGGSVLGVYAVFVAVLMWLKIGSSVGIRRAVKKRVSEAGGGGGEFGAGLLLQIAAYLAIAVIALVLAEPLNDYLRFEGTRMLVATLGLTLSYSLVRAVLEGESKVHLSALLRPLDRVVRSGVQLWAIFAVGGGVGWLVGGYAAGVAVAAIVGVAFLSLRPRLPGREDFLSVIGFARYSWLSTVESRSFSAMDTIVLGLFVSSNLIGYYEVAWNLASILAVFGTSISETVFPAISRLSSDKDREAVRGIIDDALAFTGLFVIPGLVGAAVVGEQVLRIYGPKFGQAALVLVVLVAARLIYAYEAQLVTALDAIDAPSRAFRVNLAFVLANLGLNLLLVWRFGWVGAAIGTGLAATIGLALAYRALADEMSFDVPADEIARQWAAALLMGGIVYLVEPAVSGVRAPPSVSAVALVGIGVATYFLILTGLSSRFRATIRRNVPV